MEGVPSVTAPRPEAGAPAGPTQTGRKDSTAFLPFCRHTRRTAGAPLTCGRVSPAAISASQAPRARPLPSFLLVWVGEESSRSFLCASLVLVPAFALSLVHPTNVNARASLPGFGSARGPSFLSGPDSLTWKVDVLPGHDVGAASVCAGGGACAGRVLAGPSRKGCLGKLPWTWELIR